MENNYYRKIKSLLAFVLLLVANSSLIAQNIETDSLFESVTNIDRTHARTGAKVLRINSDNSIGYQKLIPVKSGDSLEVEVYASYEKRKNKKWIKSLAVAGGIIAEVQIRKPFVQEVENQNRGSSFPFVGVGISATPGLFNKIFKKLPEAGVKVNFYDIDSSFIKSSYQYIDKSASKEWESLKISEKILTNGFIEVVLLNKSKQDVWFDDLAIGRTPPKEPIVTTNAWPEETPGTLNLYHVYVRSFAPPGSFDGFGFQDDGRGFSTSSSVTSRIKQVYTINPDGANALIAGGTPTSDESFTTSGTSAGSGSPTGSAQILSHSITAQGNVAEVKTTYEGSNPFFPFGTAPDIEVDTRIQFTENYAKTKLSLAITANSKRFPALEVFIEDQNGNRVFLIADGAHGDPSDLVYRSKFYHTATATITINISTNGGFQSVYRTGQISQTYSISNWNQQYTSQNPGPF